MLTSTILKEYFKYNQNSGEWLRLKVNSNEPEHLRFVGRETAHRAGTNRYRALRVAGKTYQAHRLAYLYMTGEWPDHDIDHINRIKNDNRWSNLRAVTKAQNLTNKTVYSNNNSGISGVLEIVSPKTKLKRWRAYISFAGRQINLGTHHSFDAAKKARLDAEVKYFLPK